MERGMNIDFVPEDRPDFHILPEPMRKMDSRRGSDFMLPNDIGYVLVPEHMKIWPFPPRCIEGCYRPDDKSADIFRPDGDNLWNPYKPMRKGVYVIEEDLGVPDAFIKPHGEHRRGMQLSVGGDAKSLYREREPISARRILLDVAKGC